MQFKYERLRESDVKNILVFNFDRKCSHKIVYGNIIFNNNYEIIVIII